MLTKEIKSQSLRTMLRLKINNTLTDNVENFDIVMSMYDLLEYSNDYSMTLGSCCSIRISK